jgi:hypothetical protein
MDHPAFVFVLVFAAVALIDAAYVLYIQEVMRGHAWAAAGISAGLHLAQAFVVISYMENRLMLISMVAGTLVGTFLAVRLRKSKPNETP